MRQVARSLARCRPASRLAFARNMATIIPLKIPALSPTMTDGKLVEWKKKEGDAVKANEVIARLETDKAVLDWESVEAGYVASLLVPDGAPNLSVGQVVGVMVEEKEEIEEGRAAAAKFKAAAAPAAPAATPAVATPAPAAKPAPAAASAAPSTVSHSAPLSPAVMYMLAFERIDFVSIIAIGKGGRITKGDILKAVQAGTAKKLAGPAVPPPAAAAAAPAAAKVTAPAAAVGGESTGRRARTHTDVPVSGMRKAIAQRLNKIATPHHYVTAKCRMDALMAIRKTLKERYGAEASLNDFIVRAAGLALRRVPELNARWDANAQQVVQLSDVDVSVAVATEGGLITPIVKGADKKRVGQIAEAVRDLAARARTGALQPAEYQGGSFTISNLGMFGITEFSGIINPPQGSLLAVGATTATVVPSPADPATLEVVQSMNATLSCDPRVADADAAQRWLAAFKEAVEAPEQLLA